MKHQPRPYRLLLALPHLIWLQSHLAMLHPFLRHRNLARPRLASARGHVTGRAGRTICGGTRPARLVWLRGRGWAGNEGERGAMWPEPHGKTIRGDALWPNGLGGWFVSQRPRFKSRPPCKLHSHCVVCTLWQGDINSSAKSPMTTSVAETDVKRNIN